AHEVGDRDVEVLGGDDGGVQQDAADGVAHRAGLGRGHALEHLDVEQVPDPAPLGEEVGEGDVVEVVRGHAEADGAGELGAQGPLDEPQVVGDDVGLRRVGRLGPAVDLGL